MRISYGKRFQFIIGFFALFFAGCKTTEYGYAVKDEKVSMKIEEKPDVLNYAALKQLEIPSLSDRAERARGGSRGLPLVSTAVSLATDAIKKMIANDRKKYIADYSFALTDLYFYDQLSAESAFDPVGMQFSGFTLLRTFVTKNGNTDTAFIAHFVLDTTHPDEIINNSIFRLRLKDLQLDHTKAKMTKAQKKTINMDIEVTFITSYVNEWGQLFDKIELGKFYLLLRNAPLDKNDLDYPSYYKTMENKPITGKSFIVPRSFGYHMASKNAAERSFSQGAYSIMVKVKESTKDKFVTTLLVDNSSKLIDALGGKTKEILTPKAKK